MRVAKKVIDHRGKENSTFKKLYVIQYPSMQDADSQQEVGDESGMQIWSDSTGSCNPS